MDERLEGLKTELLENGSDLPTVFIMRYFSNLTIAEIAESLFCSENDVVKKLTTIEKVVASRFNNKEQK